LNTIELIDLHPPIANFRKDVLEGLSEEQKRLSSKYFYNEEGSHLFEQICELEEYYLTRTETSILEDFGEEIADQIGNQAIIIEYGCGSDRKIRLLLEALKNPSAYMPIDISKDFLLQTAHLIAADFPKLKVIPICADFTTPFELPPLSKGQPVIFFPGSTIGNFKKEKALRILRTAAQLVGPGGGLLIGADLQKEISIIEKAYNDSQGLTAKFNYNLLHRINDELDGNFDLKNFRHKAFYNEEHHRNESHIESLNDQIISIGKNPISFKKGETIHIENSHKYTIEEFQRLGREAGFHPVKVWTDQKKFFSVHYFVSS